MKEGSNGIDNYYSFKTVICTCIGPKLIVMIDRTWLSSKQDKNQFVLESEQKCKFVNRVDVRNMLYSRLEVGNGILNLAPVG